MIHDDKALLVGVYGPPSVSQYEEAVDRYLRHDGVEKGKYPELDAATPEGFITQFAQGEMQGIAADMHDISKRSRRVDSWWSRYRDAIFTFNRDLACCPDLAIAMATLEEHYLCRNKPGGVPAPIKIVHSEIEVITFLDEDLGRQSSPSKSLEEALLAHALRSVEECESIHRDYNRVMSYHDGCLAKHYAAIELFKIDIDSCPRLKDAVLDLRFRLGWDRGEDVGIADKAVKLAPDLSTMSMPEDEDGIDYIADLKGPPQ